MWPPAVIINMLYASAVLQAWAPASFQQTVRKLVNNTYHTVDGLDDKTDDTGLAEDARKQRLKSTKGEESTGRRNKFKFTNVWSYGLEDEIGEAEQGKPAKRH